MLKTLVLVITLSPVSVVAQDFAIDGHLIDRCLGRNQDTPMFCVGRQADLCYEANGGGPNMVLAACQEAELAFWDATLNRTYRELIGLLKAEQSQDVGYAPGRLTDAARAMQRSWIAYRDATCGLDVARAAPFGSAAGPASVGCHMRETARQFFQLNRIAGGYR